MLVHSHLQTGDVSRLPQYYTPHFCDPTSTALFMKSYYYYYDCHYFSAMFNVYGLWCVILLWVALSLQSNSYLYVSPLSFSNRKTKTGKNQPVQVLVHCISLTENQFDYTNLGLVLQLGLLVVILTNMVVQQATSNKQPKQQQQQQILHLFSLLTK